MSPVRTTLLGSALLCLPAVPAAAQQAFEGAITYRMTSEGRSVDATFMSKGHRTRMEMEAPGMPGQMVILMDNQAMVMQMVMQSVGMYLEMDMKKAAGSGPGNATGAPPRIEKTGTSEEIAGIRCENYRMQSGDEPGVEACIATGMGYFMGGMDNPMAGRGRGNAGPNWAAYSRHFADGMLPLRVRMQRNGSWVTLMEAVSVVRKPLEDGLFRLPEGLRKMPVPGGE